MKLGFIGCGNMAQAMIRGILKRNILKPEEIIASDAFKEGLEKAELMFGINTTQNNTEVVNNSDVIILAVKPHLYVEVIKEIISVVGSDKIFVTIDPGNTVAWLT